MNLTNRFIELLLTLLMMSILSCNIIPRRVYLNNNTGKTVTLTVDSSFVVSNGTMLAAFKNALHHKRIAPGHITIGFGKGKWEKSDEESLKILLQHVRIMKDGTTDSFKLPANLTIGHGILIPELIVNIAEQNQ